MTKKVVVICIICFMLCMFIEPGLAGLQNNATGGNQETAGPDKIAENLNKEEAPPSITGDKNNLTESQKKLSTALLGQTTPLTSPSSLVKSASQSSLIMKNIPAGQATSGSQSVSAKLPSGNLVYVYVYVKPGYSTRIIEYLAVEITDRDEENHLAVAWVDVRNLETLASAEGVRMISEVIPPVVNSGSVTTQGDIIHKTADVRSSYGNKGAGMKIGIISNGVDHIANSVATGDLPANVHVLSNTVGGDEGTAMLEIVYDMAPDAELYFHDCGSDRLAFNEAIAELKASGCKIICDDISWPDEPYFEDGIIAKNVTALLAGNQIVYISSAGDTAGAHYQGSFHYYPDTYYHDFGWGTGTSSSSIPVIIPPGKTVRIFLQWNDQFGGYSGNDYDLYLTKTINGDLGKSENNQRVTGDPFESVQYINTGNSTITGKIEVVKSNGVEKTLELYIYLPDGALVDSNNIVAADSIFGHAAVPDVITVGAVSQSSPSLIESFSSRGPVTLSFPTPVIRQKPDITGVDGVRITGAGGFPTPFVGTSASAPHIAAVIAQYWGAHPSRSPSQVRSALYTSAIDLGATGKDPVYGYGRANALAMESIEGVRNMGKIGVFRPSTHLYYRDYSGNGVWDGASVDQVSSFGITGDLPVSGDWNADGRTEIGVFRPSTHLYYRDYNGNGVWDWVVIDRVSSFGITGDIPVSGKWSSIMVAPITGFSAIPTTGIAPLTVAFTDSSVNTPTSWTWSFGDGHTSTFRNPSNVYSGPGLYTVSLTATNNAGSNSTTKLNYINVTPAPVAPVAAFHSDVQTGYVPLTVAFTDDSTGTAPLTYSWNFGDTGTSTLQNPTHEYAAADTYTVSLTVTGPGGSDIETKTDYITVTPAPVAPVAAFHSDTQTGTAPLTVAFTDDSTGTAPLTYSWNFGDTGTSTLQNPIHEYAAASTYTVSLTVTGPGGSDDEVKSDYILVSEA